MTIGIIGGIGPTATSRLYKEIIKKYSEVVSENYPEIIVHSIPMNRKLEYSIITNRINQEQSIQIKNLLENSIKFLSLSKAEPILLLSNSLSSYIDSNQIINPINATIEKILNEKLDKVVIISTQMTKESGIYQKYLNEKGIEYEFPNSKDQHKINQIIFNKTNNLDSRAEDAKLLEMINRSFPRNTNIVLACTDLNPTEQDNDQFVIDSLSCMIEKTIELTIPKN